MTVNGNRENKFTSTSSKSGRGVAYFNINSGIPGKYNIVCWTKTLIGIGYSKEFTLVNNIFDVKITSKIHKTYNKIFKFKASKYLISQINLGDIEIKASNISNSIIDDLIDKDIILQISPYTKIMEYANKILPKIINKILDIGLNFFLKSLSDMYVIPSNSTLLNKTVSLRNLQSEPIKSFQLSNDEKNRIKDYNMDQLNDFVFSKFGIKFNFNMQYLSTIIENLVNNDNLNSGDPQILIAKTVSLFLQQSGAIDNPFKLPPIQTISSTGIKIKYNNVTNTYKVYNYSFPIKPGKFVMTVRVKGIESVRSRVFEVQASVLSVRDII